MIFNTCSLSLFFQITDVPDPGASRLLASISKAQNVSAAVDNQGALEAASAANAGPSTHGAASSSAAGADASSLSGSHNNSSGSNVSLNTRLNRESSQPNITDKEADDYFQAIEEGRSVEVPKGVHHLSGRDNTPERTILTPPHERDDQAQAERARLSTTSSPLFQRNNNQGRNQPVNDDNRDMEVPNNAPMEFLEHENYIQQMRRARLQKAQNDCESSEIDLKRKRLELKVKEHDVEVRQKWIKYLDQATEAQKAIASHYKGTNVELPSKFFIILLKVHNAVNVFITLDNISQISGFSQYLNTNNDVFIPFVTQENTENNGEAEKEQE